ncbi:unnamed protein product, partial [Polarella glacialis]
STLRSCAKRASWAEALELIQAQHFGSRGALSRPPLGALNLAVFACSGGGAWLQALWLMQEARLSRLATSAVTHSAVMVACVRASRWSQALSLFARLLEEPQPAVDLVVFNTALGASSASNHWPRTLALLKEMRRGRSTASLASDGPSGPRPLPSPDAASFNAALSSCERAGQSDRCLGLMATMLADRLSPDIASYSSAIRASSRFGNWEEALALLCVAQLRSVSTDIAAFSAAVTACEKGWQWEHAIALLCLASRSAVRPDLASRNAAISACEKCAQWERCLVLLDQRTFRDAVDAVGAHAAATGCARAG